MHDAQDGVLQIGAICTSDWLSSTSMSMPHSASSTTRVLHNYSIACFWPTQNNFSTATLPLYSRDGPHGLRCPLRNIACCAFSEQTSLICGQQAFGSDWSHCWSYFLCFGYRGDMLAPLAEVEEGEEDKVHENTRGRHDIC